MLVELKNGETLNGHLINCDNWMNLTLKEVVQTNPEGDRFFRLPEVYVRGNNVRSSWLKEYGTSRMLILFFFFLQIKYLRVPEEILEIIKEQQQQQAQNRARNAQQRLDARDRGRNQRGARAGRGRGRV